MADPLWDGSPLISAAASWKLRLVRLLVEGGAQVNRSDPRGETPLLAACRALRGGEPAGPVPLRLLAFLLQNQADPNARDRSGRTALMYACMRRAGAQAASVLLAAGADPSTEDNAGASALVYAINAQQPATLKVLVDACRARGRDIIIIATETGVSGGPVTRHYLNVPPCPDGPPASCMSPSDIVLRTGSPEGENVFDFRAAGQRGSSSSIHPTCAPPSLGQRPPPPLPLPPPLPPPPPRQRMSSEPWLAIHNLARLNRTYEEGVRERTRREEARSDRGGAMGDEEEEPEGRKERRWSRCGGALPRLSQSVLSLAETPRAGVEALPARWCARLRRNTLPSLAVAPPPPPPPLHLPPLSGRPASGLWVPARVCSSVAFLPRPPSSSPSSSSERSTRSRGQHSVQLEQIRGGRGGGGGEII
ncbi:ankyrin repeat domain-containing protein 34A [Clinocottus analis]|uniref:ankyrin repeat domain-containing protein 34A n=1 Tax=Clinocottus analis TaxID=304258 RepID=UPI0035C0B377